MMGGDPGSASAPPREIYVGDWAALRPVGTARLVALFPLFESATPRLRAALAPAPVGRFTRGHTARPQHREHHADPREIPLVFIPWQAMLGIMVATPILPLLLFPRVGQALTFVLTIGSGAGMIYEWTHFWIHSNYKPKTKPFKAVWRRHRLHHFRTRTTGSR